MTWGCASPPPPHQFPFLVSLFLRYGLERGWWNVKRVKAGQGFPPPSIPDHLVGERNSVKESQRRGQNEKEKKMNRSWWNQRCWSRSSSAARSFGSFFFKEKTQINNKKGRSRPDRRKRDNRMLHFFSISCTSSRTRAATAAQKKVDRKEEQPRAGKQRATVPLLENVSGERVFFSNPRNPSLEQRNEVWKESEKTKKNKQMKNVADRVKVAGDCQLPAEGALCVCN